MRGTWRGALRGGGFLLKQREPQTDHRHVDTCYRRTGLRRREAAAVLENKSIQGHSRRCLVLEGQAEHNVSITRVSLRKLAKKGATYASKSR